MDKISIDAFLSSLPIMVYGMLGIFAVILIIYVLILGLNKVFSK